MVELARDKLGAKRTAGSETRKKRDPLTQVNSFVTLVAKDSVAAQTVLERLGKFLSVTAV